MGSSRITLGLVSLLALIGWVGWFTSGSSPSVATQPALASASAVVSTQPKPAQNHDVSVAPAAPALDQALLLQRLDERFQALQAQLDKQLDTQLDSKLLKAEERLTARLNRLQLEVDAMKNQQATASEALKASPAAPVMVEPVQEGEPPAVEQTLAETKAALENTVGQLELAAQSGQAHEARQWEVQKRIDGALQAAGIGAGVTVSPVGCSVALCRFEVTGKAENGKDVLEALWEGQVFPEQTEVMTIPNAGAEGGWTVFVAAEGQSLPVQAQ